MSAVRKFLSLLAIATVLCTVNGCHKDEPSDLWGNVEEPQPQQPEQPDNPGNPDPQPTTKLVTVYATGEYPDLMSFMSKTGYSVSSYENLLKVMFPRYADPIKSYKYTYHSADPDGKPIPLSAVMYVYGSAVPESEGGEAETLDGIVLVSHASVSDNLSCPTMVAANAEGMLTWKRFATVFPDNYGLGETSSKPQAYMNYECTARGNIDALLAAEEILESKGVKYEEKYFSVGYSQGGYGAVATTKYVAEHPDLGIKFECTLAGAGPYKPELLYEASMDGKYPGAAGFVAMALVSANECAHLGFDYKAIFQEPLASHVGEWILSKEYGVWEVINKIGSSSLTKILSPEAIKEDSPVLKALLDYFRAQDVSTGWTPIEGSRFHLFHSNQDDIVPYANTELLLNWLKTFGDKAPVTELTGSYSTHGSAALWWMMDMVSCGEI